MTLKMVANQTSLFPSVAGIGETGVEHKHEWFVTFKDGRAWIKCSVCGAMRLHELEGGRGLRKEEKTKR
jgi:hypothetical protein